MIKVEDIWFIGIVDFAMRFWCCCRNRFWSDNGGVIGFLMEGCIEYDGFCKHVFVSQLGHLVLFTYKEFYRTYLYVDYGFLMYYVLNEDQSKRKMLWRLLWLLTFIIFAVWCVDELKFSFGTTVGGECKILIFSCSVSGSTCGWVIGICLFYFLFFAVGCFVDVMKMEGSPESVL